MFSIIVSLPDTPIAALDLDPNETDGLLQTLRLGIDFASDAGIDVNGALAVIAALRDHV